MLHWLAESKALLPKVIIGTTACSVLMAAVVESVKNQDQFWNLYLKWIQARQATILGEHGLRILGRVIRDVTEDNNFRFLNQLWALKDGTFSRLLCYSDSDHFVPPTIIGLSNLYEDVMV